jgi:hypothetical protein
VLSDGQWHHACVVLQRRSPASLALFVDGAHDERLALEESRLRRLGSMRNSAPLRFGRVSGAIREVGLWPRALLPEHVDSLSRFGFPKLSARARPALVRAGGAGAATTAWHFAAPLAAVLLLAVACCREHRLRACLRRRPPG